MKRFISFGMPPKNSTTTRTRGSMAEVASERYAPSEKPSSAMRLRSTWGCVDVVDALHPVVHLVIAVGREIDVPPAAADEQRAGRDESAYDGEVLQVRVVEVDAVALARGDPVRRLGTERDGRADRRGSGDALIHHRCVPGGRAPSTRNAGHADARSVNLRAAFQVVECADGVPHLELRPAYCSRGRASARGSGRGCHQVDSRHLAELKGVEIMQTNPCDANQAARSWYRIFAPSDQPGRRRRARPGAARAPRSAGTGWRSRRDAACSGRRSSECDRPDAPRTPVTRACSGVRRRAWDPVRACRAAHRRSAGRRRVHPPKTPRPPGSSTIFARRSPSDAGGALHAGSRRLPALRREQWAANPRR